MASARPVGAALLIVAATVAAARGADRDEAAERLERVRSEISRLEADRVRFEREGNSVMGHLQRLEVESRRIALQQQGLLLQQQTARADLERAQSDLEQANADLARARDRFAVMVGVLYRLGPSGPLRPLLAAESSVRLADGMRSAHELLRRQRVELAALRQALRRVEAERTRHQDQVAQLVRVGTELDRVARHLESAVLERRRHLARIERDQATRSAAIDELLRADAELRTMLAAAGVGLGPALDIRRFRGLLDRPAGKLRRGFGDRIDPRTGARLPHPGWRLEAEYAAAVNAVFDGRVVFADWFRGYGLTVVIDHGHGVHSVYAHLSVITTPKGTNVARGDSVGRAGDTGSLEGVSLYFELREHGKAVDPADWISEER